MLCLAVHDDERQGKGKVSFLLAIIVLIVPITLLMMGTEWTDKAQLTAGFLYAVIAMRVMAHIPAGVHEDGKCDALCQRLRKTEKAFPPVMRFGMLEACIGFYRSFCNLRSQCATSSRFLETARVTSTVPVFSQVPWGMRTVSMHCVHVLGARPAGTGSEEEASVLFYGATELGAPTL